MSKPWEGHLEREQPYLGDLLIMVNNHLLNGMILQVMVDNWYSRYGLEICCNDSHEGYDPLRKSNNQDFFGTHL